MNILKISHASVWRGSQRVFENLSLTIPCGQHTAIIGPNGAGKSTLLKLLSRELYPAAADGGFVELFGQRRWNVAELRHRLGIVSHDLQSRYHPSSSAHDIVMSGFYSSIGRHRHHTFSSQQRHHAEVALERAGVAHLRDRPFAKMSTGEQRRCLLARALVHQPEVLVLDEPTSGLDLAATFHYLQSIRTLIRNGTTIVLVTHHVHEIPPELEHVVLLKGGRVWKEGDKQECFTANQLGELFDVPLQLFETAGYFQVVFDPPDSLSTTE